MPMNGREMTRAELFEDEKRRIVESCFSRRDEDGSLLETYITHIKITEFQTSPTAPPAPNARTPNAEKPRVIIVGVRKSGRVRVHKSKENPNGTFSIGKTWFLDDLSAIESFTNCTYNNDYQAWAGDVGFVVTLGKPYYWQAQTDKEKKFFIASLIKIYAKYTGGRMPTLTGFDQRELDQVLGGAQAPRRQERQDRPPPRPSLPDSAPSSANNSISSLGYNGREMLNAQATQAPGPTYPERMPSRGALAPNGRASPVQSVDSGRPSQELPTLRRLASNNKSQDSVVASSVARSEGASSFRPGSRNGPGSSYGTPEASPAPPSLDERPPERRRPPMDPLRPTQVDRDLVPAPLNSPAARIPLPPRNQDRMSPRKNSMSRRDPTPLRMDQRPVTPKEISRAGTPVSAPSPAPVPTPQTASPAPAPAPAPAPDSAPAPAPARAVPAAVPTPPPVPAEESTPEAPKTPVDDEEKPGVFGIKSKKSRGEIAGAIWKAAAAVSAFKPRPGGAAERLRQNQNKSNDGPDGITSVVPAPPKPIPVKTLEPIVLEPPPTAADRGSSATTASGIPELKVTGSDPNSRPDSIVAFKEKKEEVPEEPQRSVVAGNDVKYLATLGIDPSILDGKTSEFAKWLDYFGWVPGEQMRQRNFEEMRADLDREMGKAQAGGWLARFQEEDERVDAIKRGIDLAIGECDELDNLLTLYSVELSTLSDDIAYIEAQGQGLQVQAANQKLLRKELESLLETCAISEADLEALKSAPLEHAAGVEEIETSLVTLFKAMIKIDPTMGNSEGRRSEDGSSADQSLGLDENYGQMRIVQEKKEMYLAESSLFMRRLVIFMEKQFSEAFRETKAALDGALSKKVDPRNHEVGRDILWMYGPLILYARDVDLDNWNRILQVYQDKCHPIYKTEFKEAMDAWKKNARKVTGDEAELLFTSQQEKKEEGLATTARKLTVKRSQTLARSLRSPLGDGGSRSSAAEKTPDGRALPYEVFAGVLDDLLPLVEMEQNFIVDFFHATTLEQADFPDLVAACRPVNRRGGDLKRHRLMEPDRELARRVTKAMESIFGFMEMGLQQLMDWVLGMDPLQGVGILATLERKMAEMSQSNQDFLNNLLQKLHGNLEAKFKKFVDDQIRAIEETKVKIKKRKGVIHFIRIFPQFSTAVENMLANVDPNLGIRRMVDREYDRILKSMFDSLKVIARENPAMGGGGAAATAAAIANSADPEDKEALNFHILLIENMNHYLEEVENSRGLEVLDDWKEQANQELQEHMGLYLNAVMRRPLGKLLECLENIEAQLAGGKSAAGIAAQPSNSKSTFNKVLGGYDAKEVRKGIEALRKRVEKHFGDEDSSSAGGEGKKGSSDTLSVSSGVSGHHGVKFGGGGSSQSNSGLVMKVLRECEKFYGEVEMRVGRVTTDVYGGDVLFEWPRGEVKAAFAAGTGGIGGGLGGIHLGRS